MHILLLILKVLGLTILILLGIILVLLLLLMIAPFRYAIDAEYYGDIKAVARIRWLIFVLDLKGMYGEQRFLYYLKSFGLTISTNDENDKHYKKPPDDDEASGKKAKKALGRKDKEKAKNKKVTNQQSEQPLLPDATQSEPLTEVGIDSEGEGAEEERKPGIFTRIREKLEQGLDFIVTIPMRIHEKFEEILVRILDFFAHINENVTKVVKKRDEISRHADKVMKFIRLESTKKAMKDLLKYLKQILKHVVPRKYHGKVHFGMEDPATTGQLLGAAAVLFPVYRENLVIVPDFEQKIIEGEFSAKGRVIVGFFVIQAIKVLLNRNLVKTILRAKKMVDMIGGANNGK